jgi:hypothetical protein
MAAGTGALKQALEAFNRNDWAAAEQHARDAVAETPDSADGWNLLGVVLRAAGRPAESLPHYRRALEIDRRHAGAWTNLGNACRDLGRTETAISCHRQAIAAQPDGAALYHNLGIAFMSACRWPEAVTAFSQSLTLNPDSTEVRWDRALALLCAGRWAEAWVDYDVRIGGPGLPSRPLPGRLWRGQADRQASVLVVSEQGLGDAIWCWRYLPLLRARVGRVMLECRPELAALARAQDLADEVITFGDRLPGADFHVYQCSLPGIFTPNERSIPPAPYLAAPSRPVDLPQAGDGSLRVGIVWSGSPTFRANRERAAALSRFVESFGLAGVTLFSLQFGPQRKALEANRPVPVIDLTPHLNDFADTAAALATLDLVIMTDSALAHLCGALGRPVWVLLPFSA